MTAFVLKPSESMKIIKSKGYLLVIEVVGQLYYLLCSNWSMKSGSAGQGKKPCKTFSLNQALSEQSGFQKT